MCVLSGGIIRTTFYWTETSHEEFQLRKDGVEMMIKVDDK